MKGLVYFGTPRQRISMLFFKMFYRNTLYDLVVFVHSAIIFERFLGVKFVI